MIQRQGLLPTPAKQGMQWQPRGLTGDIPKRDVQRGFRVNMSEQMRISAGHQRLDPDRITPQDHRCELLHGGRHATRIGGQVMWDRADLAPTGQSGIGVDGDHNRFHSVTGLALRHVVDRVAGQRYDARAAGA